MTRRCNDPAENSANPDTLPTPIDPADIRPGDVVERRLVDRVTVLRNEGDVIRGTRPDGVEVGLSTEIPIATWHLVHRPDPDAEAVEALARSIHGVGVIFERSELRLCAEQLAALREQGWDVVRRP